MNRCKLWVILFLMSGTFCAAQGSIESNELESQSYDAHRSLVTNSSNMKPEYIQQIYEKTVHEKDPYLGQKYYYELTDEARFRRWAVPMLSSFNLAFSGYDNNYKLVPLSHTIFCGEFTIEDIYLPARLSNDNLMRLDFNIDAQPEVRPAGSSLAFGDYKSDQYLSLVAPIKVDIEAEIKDFCVNIGAQRRFFVGETERLMLVFGANMPIKSLLHNMNLKLLGSNLFNTSFPPDQSNRTTTLTQFFNDFNSIEDFFYSEVIAPKNLKFIERQRKTGIGDISLFSYVDFANFFSWSEVMQVGGNLVLPSGGKPDGNIVWEAALGNGGAVQVEGFLNCLFKSFSPLFNPLFKFAGNVSASFTANRRLPHLVSNDERQQLDNVEGLSPVVNTFKTYYVDPFELCDSTVPFFANECTPTEVKIGSRFIVGGGNYFYNVFNLGFRLGAFYDYSRKSADTLTPKKDCACICLDCCTKSPESFHRIGWNMTYKFQNYLELNIGSQHIIAGRNVPRLHDAFISMVVVF